MKEKSKNLDLQSEELARAFAKRLRERLGDRIERVILFGSRARGEAEEDSDFDFLVLVDHFTKALEGQVRDLAYEMLDRHGAVVSAIVVPVDHFLNDRWEPLYVNARQEGINL